MIARTFLPAMPRAARFRPFERATAIALLLVLHAALFLLIQSEFGARTAKPLRHEIVLSFAAPKPEQVAPAIINPDFRRPEAPAIAPPVISVAPLTLQPQPVASDIAGIGRSLFGCDLANGKTLSAEKAANCAKFGRPRGNATAEAGMPKSSRAKYAALWTAGIAARQAPPKAPCTHIEQQVLGGPGVEKPVTAIMADPLCLLNGWLNGFHTQPK